MSWRGSPPDPLTVAAKEGGAKAEAARSVVLNAVRMARGSVAEAAKVLGRTEKTLRRVIDRLGMRKAILDLQYEIRVEAIDDDAEKKMSLQGPESNPISGRRAA